MSGQQTKRSAVFVSHRNSVEGGAGGQQVCTHEYRDMLRLAGFELHDVLWEHERTLARRVANRLQPSPYSRPWSSDLARRVADEIERRHADIVFLNVIDLLPLATDLKKLGGKHCKIVMLSHGLASVDEVHTQRILREYPFLPLNPSPLRPGDLLRQEVQFLPACDHVVSLAPFEAEICRWLGSVSNSWVPRAIPDGALERQPFPGRVGAVGTLDHPPTMEAMWLVLEAMRRRGPGPSRVRIVSGSRRQAEFFAREFPFVDDLGRLDDAALRQEASTWSAFLHPLFCFARGASTKLATGLSWGLPCITTESGMRGYELPPGIVIKADAPDDFAEAIESLPATPSLRRDPLWSLNDSAAALSAVLHAGTSDGATGRPRSF
jgi:hypothetical protein